MKFSDKIYSLMINDYNLLKTNFYQAWSMGTLKLSSMQEYARQYFHHEKNFPRYLSTIHSKCEDDNIRQIILENLIDEEKDLKTNHKALWLDFAQSIGCERESVVNSDITEATEFMVNEFFNAANKSTIFGIIAMFCYESQVPEVYKEKVHGLQKYYLINDKQGQRFFDIHLEMDKWHSDQWKGIIDEINDQDKEEAINNARLIGKSMINFLNAIEL